MGKETHGICITYAITACDEAKELAELLSFLNDNSDLGDNIVVQIDSLKGTDDVRRTAKMFMDEDHNKVIEFPLNGDFATFKNNLMQECKGDFIFFIDADEMPTKLLLDGIKSKLNTIRNTIDDPIILYLPRVNIVKGLTEDDIKKWNWNVNKLGHINFPDWQGRICHNVPTIRWEGKVHERLNYGVLLGLSANIHECLYHIKDIERQRRQNDFYETIN